MERYDLIAVGGGTAGLVSAAGAATLGLRAALVEREHVSARAIFGAVIAVGGVAILFSQA